MASQGGATALSAAAAAAGSVAGMTAQVARLQALGIRLIVFDFDQTIVCGFHSHGHLAPARLPDAIARVSPVFTQLAPLVLAQGLHLGVATFADDAMSQVYPPPSVAGEAMVRRVLSSKLGDKVASALHVAAAYPSNYPGDAPPLPCTQADADTGTVTKCVCVGATCRQFCCCGEEHDGMAAGKHWHLHGIASTVATATKQPLKPHEILLFDDDPNNVDIANEEGFIGIRVDRKAGFVVSDWARALLMVERRGTKK